LTKTKILWLLVATAALAACTSTTPPPPQVTPVGDDRFLIDPRTGYGAASPQTEQRFEAAWRYILAGNELEARKRIAEIRLKDPQYAPAILAEAAIEMRAGNLDAAAGPITTARRSAPEWIAPLAYEAELAYRRNDARTALQLYRDLASRPGAPAVVTERVDLLQTRLFDELLTTALNAPDAEAVRLLREALAYNPGAMDARVHLASRLVRLRQFEEARRELDPVLNTGDVDRPAVQEILAEIDAGRGRYQEAIVRYERLARRTKETRYNERLEQIKEEWSMANMPPQFRQALESPAVTRGDFAILLYWLVPSVRFAQNLGSPPIAIDIENVSGREEIIRAITIGLFDVDPVTRRVSPGRIVPASRLAHNLARLLVLRGAPCARGVSHDGALAACGVADPSITVPADATVSGRELAKVLAQVAKAMQ
jgi:tetratricopeptide (TPR) repeat protein